MKWMKLKKWENKIKRKDLNYEITCFFATVKSGNSYADIL